MIGFIVGLFVGAFIGIGFMSIIIVCHDADEREKKFYDRKAVEKGDEMR